MHNEKAQEVTSKLIKIAHSSHDYYQLLQDGPCPRHFEEFIASLPEGLQDYFRERGFMASRKNVLLKRFVLERAGLRMDAFLRAQLEASEYKLWQKQDAYQAELLFKLKESA